MESLIGSVAIEILNYKQKTLLLYIIGFVLALHPYLYLFRCLDSMNVSDGPDGEIYCEPCHKSK